MPDTTIGINISDPVAMIVQSSATLIVAIANASVAVRSTMTELSKDQDDRIRFQMYWDYRSILQRIGIVGDPLPWPPPK